MEGRKKNADWPGGSEAEGEKIRLTDANLTGRYVVPCRHIDTAAP